MNIRTEDAFLKWFVKSDEILKFIYLSRITKNFLLILEQQVKNSINF